MIKKYKIWWYTYGHSTFFFDQYREWYMVVTKEYNNSRLINLHELIETRLGLVYGG